MKNLQNHRVFKFILFIYIFIFWGNLKARAYGIYEVKYSLNWKAGKTDYTALIFLYSANSASNVMRLRFWAGDKWLVLEEKFSVEQFSQNSVDYWKLNGIKSYDVNDTTHLYTEISIFLSKTPNENYYKPYVASVKSNSEGIVTGNVDSFLKFDKADISNTYLADYKWKWSDSQEVFYPTKLHLILVSNSADAQLGSGFDANHRKLKSLFNDIATICGIGINIIEVNGDNFNKNYLLQTLSNFSPSSNDIVVFYYSGHGFHKNGDSYSWPYLDMRRGIVPVLDENSLSLDYDIYKPLCSKGARLTLVFGECCNMYSGALVPIKDNPLLMAPSNMLNAASIKKLFNKTGKFLLATSSPGEPSYYSINWGGEFCNGFISSLMEETGISNQQDQIKWSHLLNSAIESTQKDCALEQQKQNPVLHYEIAE